MILKLYNEFLNKLKNKEEEKTSSLSTSTDIPTAKKDRLAVNNRVKEIVKKDSFTESDISVLKKYTGFGGLGVGDTDEYFTPKALVQSMVDILPIKKNDKILDPCTGGGIFPLVLKEKYEDIQIKAIEPNPLSAKVASAILNQKVEKKGFEEVELKEKFDYVVTNVPFGMRSDKERVLYPEFENIKRLESFIIIKSLMSIKPLGLGVFITNSRIMNGNCKHLPQIQSLGEIIGAVRLPNAIFADSGADVITDIIVIRTHDEIVDLLNQTEKVKRLIKPFDIANYFKDNPSHILGKTITKEEQIEQALKEGKKVHHQAQKDRVETTQKSSDIFKKANEIMKTFKGTINYKLMTVSDDVEVRRVTLEESNTLVSEVMEAFNTISSNSINISTIRNLSQRMENQSNPNLYEYKEIYDSILRLYELGIKDTTHISNIVGLKPIKKSVWEGNKEILEKIALKKPSWSSTIFEAVKKAYMHFEQAKEKPKELEINLSKESYTNKEIMKGLVFIGGKTYRIGDNNLSLLLDGKNKKELEELIELDKIDDNIFDEYKKMIGSYFADNVNNIDIKRLKIDLELGHYIFNYNDKLSFLRVLRETKSIEKKLTDNIVDKFKKEKGREYSREEIIGGIRHSFRYEEVSVAFSREILMDAKEPRFKNQNYNAMGSDADLVLLNGIIKTEFYAIKDVIEALFSSSIKERKTMLKALEQYAEDRSIFVHKSPNDGGVLNEIEDLVKKDWINKAHFFQNSDARNFSDKEEGTIRYDTGLGKSLEAMLISAKLIKTNKKVAYIVPNEIIGKMEAEIKKVFTKQMLDKVLVVTSISKESIIKASNPKYKFLLMTSSVLVSQFKLSDEVTKDLYGVTKKEANAGYTPKFGIELNAFVKYPKYAKTASYNFEDLNLDTIIIDEAHRFKNAVSGSTVGVKGLTTTTSNNSLIMLFFAMYIKYVKRNDGKGVILSTATPITSSPTEILSLLLFSTDVKNFKKFGIDSGKMFEKTFFNIVSKETIKTDGSLAISKMLEGIRNLDMLRNLGWHKVIKRTAEEESILSEERGKTIDVKPSYTDIRIDVADKGDKNKDYAKDLSIEYNRASSQLGFIFNPQIGYIQSGVSPIKIIVLKEFGELFSLLDSFKKLSLSESTSMGYTAVELGKDTTKDEVMKALGKIKVKVKIGTIKQDKFGMMGLQIKLKDVPLSEYEQTEYYIEKKNNFNKYHKEIYENGIVYLPSLEYPVIKRAMTALKKFKPTFDPKMFAKLATVADTVVSQFVAFPKSKQIIYSPILATHHILQELITKKIKGKIKFYHFNGTTVKNADKKLEMQIKFNEDKGKSVLIFGASGKVGVDFNENVSSVHLVDVGLTPEDKEQAKGRAVRQGNKFSNVSVFHYYQDNTLDNFLENIVDNKQDWISNVEKEDFSSSSFNSDSLETISKLAEKSYPSPNLSIEEKITRYLAKVERMNRAKRKAIDRALMEQEVKKVLRYAYDKALVEPLHGDIKKIADVISVRKYNELENLMFGSPFLSAYNPSYETIDGFNDAIRLKANSLIASNWNDRKSPTLEQIIEELDDTFRSVYTFRNLETEVLRPVLTKTKKTVLQLLGKSKSYLNDIPKEKTIYKYFLEVYNSELNEFQNRLDYFKNIDKRLNEELENIGAKLNIRDTNISIIIKKLENFDGEAYLHGGQYVVKDVVHTAGMRENKFTLGICQENSLIWYSVRAKFNYILDLLHTETKSSSLGTSKLIHNVDIEDIKFLATKGVLEEDKASYLRDKVDEMIKEIEKP